jgi:hypothetical protein
MNRRFPKRKPVQNWRVIPKKITPRCNRRSVVRRILQRSLATHSHPNQDGLHSAWLTCLNQHLQESSWQVSSAMLQDWLEDRAIPSNRLLAALLHHAPPLSWPWQLAFDLLTASLSDPIAHRCQRKRHNV